MRDLRNATGAEVRRPRVRRTDRADAGPGAGYVQANLVVVPRELAFDFLLFCQRNPKPCPLLDVTEPGVAGAAARRRRRRCAHRRAALSRLPPRRIGGRAGRSARLVARRLGGVSARLFVHVRASAAGSRRAGAAPRTGLQCADVSHQHRVPAGRASFTGRWSFRCGR